MSAISESHIRLSNVYSKTSENISNNSNENINNINLKSYLILKFKNKHLNP